MNTLIETHEPSPLENHHQTVADILSCAPRRKRGRPPRAALPPLPAPAPEDPETDTLRLDHEGQAGNWLRIGHGCYMKKNHGR